MFTIKNVFLFHQDNFLLTFLLHVRIIYKIQKYPFEGVFGRVSTGQEQIQDCLEQLLF